MGARQFCTWTRLPMTTKTTIMMWIAMRTRMMILMMRMLLNQRLWLAFLDTLSPLWKVATMRDDIDRLLDRNHSRVFATRLPLRYLLWSFAVLRYIGVHQPAVASFAEDPPGKKKVKRSYRLDFMEDGVTSDRRPVEKKKQTTYSSGDNRNETIGYPSGVTSTRGLVQLLDLCPGLKQCRHR
jgi:hypothetical protein